MPEKNLIISKNAEIGLVTINRPRVLNALNMDILAELYEVITQFNSDQVVKVIIITGSGKAFIAGADIAEMRDFTREQATEFSLLGHKTMDAIQSGIKPVIAAVNGYALGGGLELALACDIILASTTALLGLPEVNLGLIQGFGGTQRLSRLVGKTFAKELIFTGEPISAQRAHEMGIVNKVVPSDELIPEAKKLAHKIAEKGPIALALAKKVIEAGFDKDLREACKLEVDAFSQCFTTEDRKEGISAFLEKRKPRFTNQ